MSSIGSLTRFVHELRSPDLRQRDEAARIIWERFAPRLTQLVRRHLDHRIFRREDEQDILQSMFASFYQGQYLGKATPASRQELWKLLVRITMCKVVNTATSPPGRPSRHPKGTLRAAWRLGQRTVRRLDARPRRSGPAHTS